MVTFKKKHGWNWLYLEIMIEILFGRVIRDENNSWLMLLEKPLRIQVIRKKVQLLIESKEIFTYFFFWKLFQQIYY